ncbi:MAG: ergothioneine biosynthesis protein EgtB [Phycisphaeraceae bacterium]
MDSTEQLSSPHTGTVSDRAGILAHYVASRAASDNLCKGLEPEDLVIQSMSEVSPLKWHLAHTTWFYEQFVLEPRTPNYHWYHEQYPFLFNSYYQTVGPMHCRAERGLLSRPTVQEVYAYRKAIDHRIAELLDSIRDEDLPSLAGIMELGRHHEQQHQELILTDIKHIFSSNPLMPAYHPEQPPAHQATRDQAWVPITGGRHVIGHANQDFCFDNEQPRHEVLIQSFELADRLVTNAEFQGFIDDGGYQRHDLWLSMGWDAVNKHNWTSPLYWFRQSNRWMEYALNGPRPLHDHEPVSHISYFEADAYARWAGHRLPTEAEWETAAQHTQVNGNLAEQRHYHPVPADDAPGLRQMFGDTWEWTASPYTAYPGYKPHSGAIGEYNGKFMCNQYVLRGGSCATPASHIRHSYRNFFYPDTRWQFTGLRLARDTIL